MYIHVTLYIYIQELTYLGYDVGVQCELNSARDLVQSPAKSVSRIRTQKGGGHIMRAYNTLALLYRHRLYRLGTVASFHSCKQG